MDAWKGFTPRSTCRSQSENRPSCAQRNGVCAQGTYVHLISGDGNDFSFMPFIQGAGKSDSPAPGEDISGERPISGAIWRYMIILESTREFNITWSAPETSSFSSKNRTC